MKVARFAPRAASGTWYPQRFLAPLAQNEPYLTSALSVLAEVVAELVARGISRERVVLAGFSQGACLALEFAARHPSRHVSRWLGDHPIHRASDVRLTWHHPLKN